MDSTPVPLPFTVDRGLSVPLTEQIVRGIRGAIADGALQPGARLPSIRDMAAELSVSNLVVRNAVRRLSEGGDVVARPKRGIEVLESGRPQWRAHVLYISMSNTFYFAQRDRTFEDLALQRGIRISRVMLSGLEYSSGFPRIRTILDTQPIDLGIIEGTMTGVAPQFSNRGIPFVTMGDPRPLGQARGQLIIDKTGAFRAFLDEAERCGVQSIGLVYPQLQHSHEFEEAAAGRGFLVESVFAGSEDSGTPEAVERVGFRAVANLRERGEPLPDLFFFPDDYAARGGMTALLSAGVRIPEAVSVAALTNAGHTPVLGRELTRLEMDPEVHGRQMLDLTEAALSADRPLTEPFVAEAVFHRGETMPAPPPDAAASTEPRP
jgi:DNA-binding transcriptional regulator YhcF (GntR family)